MFDIIEIITNKRQEFVNISDKINKVIADSRIKEGICFLQVPHTTAALTLNENADPDVMVDLSNKISELIPKRNNYTHSEGNSDSHIKSSLFGAALTLFIKEGTILLGTWQTLFFCEFDGPRNRSIYVKIIER